MSETQQAGSQDGPIDLCVVHGHLAFARFPVLVGHYVGDAFAGTEARLDRALDGRLAERRKLGLYPGRIGANAVLLDSDCKPPGSRSRRSRPAGRPLHRDAAGNLAAGHSRICGRDAGSRLRKSRSASNPATELGLSCLLVGAGEGGIDRISCVQALLQAVAQANAMLGGRPKPKLRALEIIELFEDRAYETGSGREEGDRGRSRSQERLFAPAQVRARGAEAAATRRSRRTRTGGSRSRSPCPLSGGRRIAASRSPSAAASRGRRRERSPPTSTSSRRFCAGRLRMSTWTARRSRRGASCSNCCGRNR